MGKSKQLYSLEAQYATITSNQPMQTAIISCLTLILTFSFELHFGSSYLFGSLLEDITWSCRDKKFLRYS